ncbi:MAG: aspartyl/asparaginyl beta-hydroxylase domain-containing protein [Burkholderiales bacterium]
MDLPSSAGLVSALLSWKATFVYGYVAWALFVHYRGRERHRFHRQLTDHSTVIAPYNAVMYGFSAVPNTPFVDVARFPELKPLQDHWQAIRDEALALFDDGHIRAAATYNDLGFNSFFRRGWKRFYLKWYDAPLESARALCPRTVALVEAIPAINGAMFALLPAGGDLGRHRDPFAGSLRYHLGLRTPNSDACRIVVDGQSYAWRDGEAVMFDETYVHWAENRTDQDRLILFCDVERPLSRPWASRLNHWIERTIVRATQTENVPGEKVGLLNRIFGIAYYVRLPAKALKRRNKYLYYAGKWLLLTGIVWAVFFLR